MTNPFISADVRAVVASLDGDPEAWSRDGNHRLRHNSGLGVWISNRSYGVEILHPGGKHLWGGVTARSSFGLSPSHWALSNAIGRWQKVRGGTAASYLNSRTSTPGEA